MSTIDFTKPASTDLYTAWPTEIQAAQLSFGFMLDPTYVTGYTGLSAGMQRFNRSGSGLLEYWTGSAWAASSTGYLLDAGDTITGNLVFSGSASLGIGTTPSAPFHLLRSSANAVARFSSSGGSGRDWNLTSYTNGTFSIGSDLTADQLSIQAGNVGIGTTPSGSYRLNISATANGQLITSPSGSPQSTVTDGNVTVYTGYTSGASTSAVAYYGTSSAHALGFITGNAERMRITSGGAMGFNKTPGVTYDFLGAGDMLRLGSGSGNNVIQCYSSGGTLGLWAGGSSVIYSNGGIGFQVGATTGTSFPTGGQTGMTLDSTGFLTVAPVPASGVQLGLELYDGSTGSGEGLYVQWETGSRAGMVRTYGVANATAGGDYVVAVNTANTGTPTERMRIQAQGNTVFSGGVSTTTNALGAASGAITANCALSNVHTLTLNGNMTSLTLSNMQDGQTVNIQITQDATGSRLLGGLTSANSYLWPGGAAGTLSTVAGAVDLLVVTKVGTKLLCTLAKAFS